MRNLYHLSLIDYNVPSIYWAIGLKLPTCYCYEKLGKKQATPDS